jgi:hypothetical protein
VGRLHEDDLGLGFVHHDNVVALVFLDTCVKLLRVVTEERRAGGSSDQRECVCVKEQRRNGAFACQHERASWRENSTVFF